MAADTLAQHEFNELMRDKESRLGHPEDHDDARSFLNLSEDEDDEHHRTRALRGPRRSHLPPGADYDDSDDDDETGVRRSMTQSRHIIPRRRYGANTGPKGVISDAQNYRDSQRQHRMGSHTPPSVGVPTTAFRNGLQIHDHVNNHTTFVNDDSDEHDTSDADDDAFMAQWRDSRLKELQNGTFQSAMHNRERKQEWNWRGLRTVDAEGYLDAVDHTPANVVVAVYIYDDSSEVSQAFDDCLRAIARKHGSTRFVRLHYSEAEMETAGVPALIGYRGGDKFVGLVPLIHELADDTELTPTALEVVLKRHGVI